jgi:hypothetical protein
MTQAMLINKYSLRVYRKNYEISDLYEFILQFPHDFQNKADFGSGDFQYTCPRASCEQSACAWPVVSIGIGIIYWYRKSNLNSLTCTLNPTEFSTFSEPEVDQFVFCQQKLVWLFCQLQVFRKSTSVRYCTSSSHSLKLHLVHHVY